MTRRLEGGRLGGADGQAVAAVNTWREYDVVQRFTPLVTSSPTPASYLLATTPSLAGGQYQTRVLFFLIGSASGTDIAADVEVDGISPGVILTEAAVAGGGFLLNGIVDQVWSPGSHTIELFVSQPAGPGQVTAATAQVSWERKA